MDYTFRPSLEHITLIKIATTLWNQIDIRHCVERFSFQYMRPSDIPINWQVVENKVIENIPLLLLPEPLKKEVLNLIKPIGLEILKWRKYHHLPKKLCWTPLGTIDRKETAKELIMDEFYDITIRYIFACVYCLEDDIRELWNKIPENSREFYYRKSDSIIFMQQELVDIWTDEMKGEVNKLDGRFARRRQIRCYPYQRAFEFSANRGNKAAIEYFLQKLTPREREELLVRTAVKVARKRFEIDQYSVFPQEDYTEVLCYLLSQMDEGQQTEVFKSCSCEVLKCLLDWPWQRFFMETLKTFW